jgi:short-subunit dehydrogenase
MSDFQEQYGPWALVAGGAEGIGAAYVRHAAARGLNVVVLDVAADALARSCRETARDFGVECLAVEVDLASEALLPRVVDAVADREVGLLVYNAGLADVGPFYKEDSGLDYELHRIAVNVTGPFSLAYHFGRPMLARRRGGIILMSSGAGFQGSPYYAHYSATRAYNIVLAEALWAEFKPYDVDVLACAAGMTLSTAADGYRHLDTSGFQTPDELVEEALAALGNQCTLVAGKMHRENRAAAERLPREKLIEVMGRHAIDSFLGGEAPPQKLG